MPKFRYFFQANAMGIHVSQPPAPSYSWTDHIIHHTSHTVSSWLLMYSGETFDFPKPHISGFKSVSHWRTCPHLLYSSQWALGGFPSSLICHCHAIRLHLWVESVTIQHHSRSTFFISYTFRVLWRHSVIRRILFYWVNNIVCISSGNLS